MSMHGIDILFLSIKCYNNTVIIGGVCMVNGGTVRGDAESITQVLSSYQSELEGLSSSWQGSSFDGIASKGHDFVTEYLQITNQISSFATACDLYQSYDTAKKNYQISVNNYNAAAANNDRSGMSRSQSDINTASEQIQSFKTQIESALAAASSPTLTATAISGTVDTTTSSDSTTTGQTATDQTAVDAADAIKNASVAMPKIAAGSVSDTSQKAVDFACSIAADNRYGYVSGGMGNGGYDCTQLIHAAYEAAGVSLPERGYVNNSNIVEYYTQNGFEWVPGPINQENLQPGDVLVNRAHHAEMYVGNGQKVGAHDNYDGGAGDSSGGEISVDPYKEFANGGWDGYLRYTG